MQSSYFSNLLPELATRAARATISKLGFSNPPLRQHLLEIFARGYGQPGCFLGDPVFEATFGWKTAEPSLQALAKDLLHPHLVDALDAPWGENGREYRFPRDAKPYVHQLASWQALLSPGHRSVVVTSGTGSGKTECFMVPVLSSLAQARAKERQVKGVRALFLYPLNALIQSQRERLRAWTGHFNGDIRFCLYNGTTPEQAKAEKYREAPNEVHDRATLRREPPAILVTNPTMLEYMLVRAQDAPILEQSRGKLEWIVLDEAHNYIGSQAAELALLLRRVLHAFGTEAQRVHFIATSATIGAGDSAAKGQLQEFLAKLAGVTADRVVVVEGERAVPGLDALVKASEAQVPAASIAQLEDTEARYQRVAAHPVARRLRESFVATSGGRPYQPLSAIRGELAALQQPNSDTDALEWLDVLTSAQYGAGRATLPFLPLRLHAFHNTLNGLWACANPACGEKARTALEDPRWPFGQLYLEERRHCACGAPVYPLTSCNDCNETYLRAELVQGATAVRLVAPLDEQIDEFTLERDAEEDDAPGAGAEADVSGAVSRRTQVLVVNGDQRGGSISLDSVSLEVLSGPSDRSLTLRYQDVHVVDGEEVLKCPCCDGSEPPTRQFRKPILGAPFLLSSIIPTLLEFCPDGETPLDAPMRGRRMITFTDSRQGTARIAAQLQQDAERNALRAAVYRKLVTAPAAGDNERRVIEDRLSTLRSVLKANPKTPGLAAIVQGDEEALRQLDAPKAVGQPEMVAWLAGQVPDISRWIHAYYSEFDGTFRGPRGKELLSEILLCREFARRPKRQNSLETMGLVAVQYPKLASVTRRSAAVEQAGLSLEEWRQFLKICLDFYVRQNFCLQVPTSWERWGGHRVYPRQILPPSSQERTTSRLLKWPRVLPGARQNRLVRLLAYVLKVDPQSDSGRDRVDSLLLAAWQDLAGMAGLLQLGGDQARYLAMSDLSFQPLTKGWMCPVTRRVLDVTLRGITPYLPERQLHEGVAQCRAIEIPLCAVLAQDFASETERLAAAREWVSTQPLLNEARIEGVWSSLNDRVIEGAGYFRAVEHSAQQSGSRLQQYEGQFKRGFVNLMSCSTTMEMGVDIGGINTVAMNNVPPHPANYLQRAGRAGRRSETRSVALTVCKNNPHDQHVFRNTSWPFATRLATPGISLSSPMLVQRHINALVLSQFLRLQDREGKLDKLTLDWWMLPRGTSRQERFVAWCECFDPKAQTDMAAGIHALVQRTVFDGRQSAHALVNDAGAAAAAHAIGWMAELTAIDEQITDLSQRSQEDRIPLKALQIQRKRLTDEYLLRELATSGFLPGYGFPTDITTFETLNKDSLELTRARDGGGREDNRYQRRELPSRDTVTALREYAPGASVVIDGLVYQSAGITLNWHTPASADQVNELQNIRQAWRCARCGASGTGVLAMQFDHCPECGAALTHDSRRFTQYLEPAGFSVDLFAETHNDITLQDYVPVEQPWISGKGEWLPLANPALGAFRSCAEGSVFHFSAGAYGSGYAVCLECGRATPMGNAADPDSVPQMFKKPHKRLRGRRGDGDDWNCGGSDNDFKIKRGVSFGREYTTDVLEISLVSASGHPLTDADAAFTIAVALRRAVAEHLGVDLSELGCDSKEVRDLQGRRTRVVQIFDLRSGGYASLVAPHIAKLLRDARHILCCPSDCDSACQNCLLTFDTRYRLASLNRRAALLFLSQEWLDGLQLAPDDQLLGTSSQSEYQSLQEAITRELNRTSAKRLYVYPAGDLQGWDLPSSPLRYLLHRLSVRQDVELVLALPNAELHALSQENSSILRSIAQVCGVRLAVGTPPALEGPGACVASVESRDGAVFSWATRQAEAAVPDKSWGRIDRVPLVACPTGAPNMSASQVSIPVAPLSAASVIQVSGELDGPGEGFGKRFWALVRQKGGAEVLPLDAALIGVRYDDRYLATPLSCALLVEVLSALKQIYEQEDRWAVPMISVQTMLTPERTDSRYRDQWTSDWPDAITRDAVLSEALDYSGMTASVTSRPKRDLIHGRRLQLEFEGGKEVTIWMDQGLSYWTIARQQLRTSLTAFPVHGDTAAVAARLAEIKVSVEGHELPTQLFADRK